jgi:hypothetical protein
LIQEEEEMTTMTRARATIIRQERDSRTYDRLPDQRVEIEADDENALLALFFREYDNRYKYCNTLSYAFEDPAMRAKYVAWMSDISNYMNNGGDMW